MSIKIKLKHGVEALNYAIRNPRFTIGEYFVNPIKVLEYWYSKSHGLNIVQSYNFTAIVRILDKMHDELSKEAYIKEVCYQGIASHSLAKVSSLSDVIGCTTSKEEWNKRLSEASKLNLPYKFTSDLEKKSCSIGYIYPQYEYKEKFIVESNDIIIDCGAYVGDTDLWFEKKLGDNGKIYAFEPHSVTRAILEENIKNFGLGKIEVAPYATSNTKGKIYFSEEASGGSAFQKKSKLEIETISLDEFCLDRPEPIIPTFIKMDIEGAELLALEGAKEIISKYTPKLAICTYHKTSHLWEIPELIMQYSDKYTFCFNKHHPINEAVLYAIPNK